MIVFGIVLFNRANDVLENELHRGLVRVACTCNAGNSIHTSYASALTCSPSRRYFVRFFSSFPQPSHNVVYTSTTGIFSFLPISRTASAYWAVTSKLRSRGRGGVRAASSAPRWSVLHGGGVRRMTLVSGEYHSDDGEVTIWMIFVRFSTNKGSGTCCSVPGRVASFAPNQIVRIRTVGKPFRASRFAKHCRDIAAMSYGPPETGLHAPVRRRGLTR